jgi:hypothetical protein
VAPTGRRVEDDAVGLWLTFLDTLHRDYEVLIADATARPAETPGPNPRVKVVGDGGGAGYGARLRAALAAARHPLFLYVDGTRAYQPPDLAELLKAIDQVDLVAGHRVWPPGHRRGFLARLVQRCALRAFFGVRLKDTDCAFKLFRRAIFARIPIQSDGDFVHAEIIAKANFLGCLITEVPVSFRPFGTAPSRGTWAEGYRVFREPDFGPAVLPEVAKPGTPEPLSPVS